MTKQEEIMRWMAKWLFEDDMDESQCFGLETRRKVWRRERRHYLAKAYNLLYGLDSKGAVLKAEKKVPLVTFTLIGPMTPSEVSKIGEAYAGCGFFESLIEEE